MGKFPTMVLVMPQALIQKRKLTRALIVYPTNKPNTNQIKSKAQVPALKFSMEIYGGSL